MRDNLYICHTTAKPFGNWFQMIPVKLLPSHWSLKWPFSKRLWKESASYAIAASAIGTSSQETSWSPPAALLKSSTLVQQPSPMIATTSKSMEKPSFQPSTTISPTHKVPMKLRNCSTNRNTSNTFSLTPTALAKWSLSCSNGNLMTVRTSAHIRLSAKTWNTWPAIAVRKIRMID